MKNLHIFILLIMSINDPCLCQGIFAGDIEYAIAGGILNRCEIEIDVFSESAIPSIVVDWGDDSLDTINGQSFSYEMGFYNSFKKIHTYVDTGYFTISYESNNWISGISNFTDSESQLFLLQAQVLITDDPTYEMNTSSLFAPETDNIITNNEGVIIHNIVYANFEFDSVMKKMIPIPVPGYYIPEATDTLECCFTWDKPLYTGKYAFGFEFEEWRGGKFIGSTQRFITVEVDFRLFR